MQSPLEPLNSMDKLQKIQLEFSQREGTLSMDFPEEHL